ncbi:MAG TPA: TonB-dependent receptor [Burkholderiaceae bacterium]
MRNTAQLWAAGSVIALHVGHAAAQSVPPAAAASEPETTAPRQLDAVVITGSLLGKGEARANSVVDRATIREQPAGLDPLKVVNRVVGLQVSSGDALGGSFSMRLSMRGLNKEQIGVSVDGIPNGSTLSNGGTMPNRLLEPANLQRIDVSQTAGEIGTPSNQALGGFIDFKTRDPSRTPGGEVEFSLGNYGYHREFFRYDTGEFGSGTRAYVDASQSTVRTWPNDQSGRSERKHADLRVLQDLGGGNSLRATVSYNDLNDNDYGAVALRAISAPYYLANFENTPDSDGLTDQWTGNPAIDQNNRRTRGIGSREWFAHLDGTVHFGDTGKLTASPYYHHQEGEGWFYVPYKQVPANGVVYSSVAEGGKPVATAQECFANQYARDANGALIPVSSVTYPAGVTAASLSAAGCPAAAKYAMNPRAQWGPREASRRLGGYEMSRMGTLAEVSATIAEVHDLRAGGWYEHINREKTRNWYLATDPTVDYAYVDSALYSITQDRHYRSNSAMVYLQDRMHLLGDKLELDVGVTYQRFAETYRSPVEFAGERALTVSSNLLPKLGALYRLSDQLEVFASAAKNFSAIPDSVFEGTSAIDAKTGIKPETSTNIDAGVRWTSGKTGLSVQVYSIDYRDRISIQNGNPNGDIFSRDATTTFLNQGGISSRGIELTGETTVGRFSFYGNYAYNDAHYTRDTPAEGIAAGDRVLGAPHHSAFAEVTWRPTDPMRLTTNVKYVSKAAGTYHDVPNNGTIKGGPSTYPQEFMPAYALVGVSAAYKFGPTFNLLKGVELAMNVDNLFNKRYLGGLGAELTTSNPLTTGRYFLGSPRTFFVTLRAQI